MKDKDEKLKKISKEIRDIIELKQQELDLKFVEDTHTYYIRTKEGDITTEFPSVSTVIKQFYEDFPALEKSLDMCDGDIFEQDKLLKEWRLTADYANSKGSRVHYLLEKDLLALYGSYKDVRKPIFECDSEQIRDGNAMIDAGHDFIRLMHRRGAILLDTEMVLGSNELKYTGQPDKVWIMFNDNNELGFIVTDWKGLPLDTPILTNSGWKTMGELDHKDEVYDKDGNLVKILNISKVKNKKCLKIVFDNKDEIVSDYEHRWLITTYNNEVKETRVMTSQEISDYLKSPKHLEDLLIESSKPLNNIDIDLPITPYIFGGLISEKYKHMLDLYLNASYTQRLDVLRGVMDNNGRYNEKIGRFELPNIGEDVLEFYISLISSLGIKVSNVLDGDKFNISFKSEFNPFSQINQDIQLPSLSITDVSRVIISVEEVDTVPTKCIEVDSPTSTFLCGKNLLVTHNTNKPKNFLVQPYTVPMLPPFEDEMDTALGHYKIQLPLYARLILDMLKGTKYEDIKLFGCIIVHLTAEGNFTEFRVPSNFINKVLTMSPLPRIDEVMSKKKNDVIAEDNRVKLLNSRK